MNRLEEIRTAKGLSGPKAAQGIGIKYTRYRSYEKEERQMDSETLIKIADFYDVSIDYILCRDEKVVQFKAPFVQKYENLDETSRKVVDSVIDIEASRTEEIKAPLRIIPLFSQSFAAGPSDNFAEDAWEDYEVPEDSKADFAVRISGDSMEPELHDGQIYLCKRRYPEIGEICVAMVNGGFYVKQFITDGHHIYLRSVNRARKDNDIDIMESGQYTGKCLGTVIHKRIPLVEQ